MRYRAFIGIILVLCLGLAEGVFAEFPAELSRAEAEFRGLLPMVHEWPDQDEGGERVFRRMALPFAPLYLEIRSAASHKEGSDLMNFFFGYVGAGFGVKPDELAHKFHCGRECIVRRRSALIDRLRQIEELVSIFRTMEKVRLLADWDTGDDLRINDLYRIAGRQRIARPSPVMGFVLSGTWEPVDSVDRYIESLGESPRKVRGVLKTMRKLGIAAIVRDAGGVVRVVKEGMSDNESGLLFTVSEGSEYILGEKMKDGREVRFVQKLGPNVYFYETT